MYHNNLEVILESDKEYEDIAAKRIPHREDVLKALDMVRDFIKKKKLILYGGIAIDYALKHAGHVGIYADDAVPDYDFASPNFYNDSNELADILYEAGFKNVSVINAVHITTRRVRVNYEFVADITYYPQNIFDVVPTLQYNGLLFVHPNFQRMDMHIELCYPFDNPPWEVLQHRTRKTIKRFKLINEVYPIAIKPAKLSPATISITITVPIKSYRGGAHLSGIVGYAILHKLVYEMFFNTSGILAKSITKLGAVNSKSVTTFESIYNCNWKVEGNNLHLTVPDGCDYINELSFDEQKNNYYAYLDYIRPPYYEDEGSRVEKYDLHLKQVPCYNLTKLSKITKCDDLVNLNMPIVHMILLYFLQRYHETQNNNYLMLYDSCMKLCDIAESIFYTMYEQNDAKLNKMVDELYYEMPIFLSSKVCGKKSVKEAYEAYLLSSKYIIENIPRADQVVLRPPSSYTPGDQKPQEFIISSSPFFNISGLSTTPKQKKTNKEKKEKK